jgi:hypothetical protein
MGPPTLSIAITLCGCASWTRADVTITESVAQEFAGVGAKFTQVQTVRGSSLRVEDSASAEAWIYDAAAGAIIRLDAQQREARTYDAVRARADAEREVHIDASASQFSATGRTRLLRGRACREYRFDVRVPLGSATSATVALGSSVRALLGAVRARALLVRGSVWIASSGAGVAEYVEFHRRAAERGVILSDAGARDQGDGLLALALVRARAELDRQVAALGGMPWAMDLTVRPQSSAVLARLDLRLRGRQRTRTIAVTTDAISDDAFAVPPGWQNMSGEEGGLYRQVRHDPGDGGIRVLGRRLWLGVGLGASSLTSGAARIRLGQATFEPVIRLVGPLASQGVGLSVAPVFRHYSTRDFAARVLAPTAGLVARLAAPRKGLVPFVAVRAGPYFVSLRGSDTRLRPGGTVEWGVSYRRRLVLSGSYDLVTPAKGVNLSSWSLDAVVRVF